MLPPKPNVGASSPTTTSRIHVNPDFTRLSNMSARSINPTTHINPEFLRNHKVNSIHMNPEFLLKQEVERGIYRNSMSAFSLAYSNILQHQHHQQQQQQHHQQQQQHQQMLQQQQQQQNIVITRSSVANDNGTQSGRIISKSLRQIIRQPVLKKCNPAPTTATADATAHAVSSKSIVIKSKRKLIRFNKTLVPPPRALTTISSPHIKRKLYNLTNYSLRRKPVDGVELGVRSPSSRKHPPPVALIASKNKKLQLVNINGVLYKSTKNKLQLNDTAKTLKLPKEPDHKLLKRVKTKPAPEPSTGVRTLFVRGSKYVMDGDGFKLTRVQPSTPSGPSKKVASVSGASTNPNPNRIDIGGFTYVRSKTKNEYVRTRYHLALAHLNSAKQRSVMLLSRNLVKSNVPCAIYQRLGKCFAHERGRCNKLHDKKYISICPRFLKGDCASDKCLLSHEVSLSKMPVCKFYLEGVCTRKDCPYLHKKLNESAGICENFRRGFCELAEKCVKRHVFQCAKMNRQGKCEKKHCLSCVVDQEQAAVQGKSTITDKSPDQRDVDSKPNADTHKRYFLEFFKAKDAVATTAKSRTDSDQSSIADDGTDNAIGDANGSEDTDNSRGVSDDANDDETGDDSVAPPVHRRVRGKLPDKMPAFIPLS